MPHSPQNLASGRFSLATARTDRHPDRSLLHEAGLHFSVRVAETSRNEAPGKPRRRIRKLRFALLLAILGLLCLATFTFGFVTAIATDVPSLDPAKARKAERNGYIYAADGTVLAVLRSDQSRILVGSAEIAPIMKQAIVAVEDRRFWEHRGVDLRGILRAVWNDVRNKELVQGGSTITQQLVKNTYIKPERTVSRKLKEAALAWQLERRWSKDRILTDLPEHDLLRQRRLRDRDGRQGVLQEARERADAPRGGAPRGDTGQPDRLRPGGEPDAGARPPQHRARADVRAGADHEDTVRGRETRSAAERRAGGPARHAGPGPVLRRVRQTAADRLLRLGQGLRRRAQGAHVDRPAPSEARARGDRQVADEEERARGRARRDRPHERAGARHGRRRGLLEEPVQPGHPGRAPARLVVQAVRARSRARPGRLAQHDLPVEASGDQHRRQALGGQQLRERLPRRGQPSRRPRSTPTTRCTPS